MFSKDLFKGKIALVTGGGSGIGFAIARQMLSCGAVVWIASRKEERINNAVQQLSEFGEVHGSTVDIRDRDSVQLLLDTIKAKHAKLDILINNGGGQFPSAAEDISPNGWNAVVNNNLNGSWNMCQMVFKAFFEKQKQGVIVNIIVNIFRGVPGMAHTAAARGGIEAFSKTLAVEWCNRGVRINCIAPGIIQSSGLENYPPELLHGISDKIPMKRLGSVDEIAWSALFLASPMATYITGDTLYVDGGQRLWGDIWTIDN
ncbi:MAG: SDR family oxidoreductase [Saprospiraceae bacterium]